MKTSYHIIAMLTTMLLFTGCEKNYLDINTNPNNILAATPESILPGALNTAALIYSRDYNAFGGWTGGYFGKTGTVNGFDAERTYSYTSNSYQALWNDTYRNLEDFHYIEKNGAEKGLVYHAAIAKIMKAFWFQQLVDQYGNLPYSKALLGSENLKPEYDKAEAIYTDLNVQLTAAVALIDGGTANTPPVKSADDIVFKGVMSKWKQLANTLRLRVLLRQSQVPALQGALAAEFAKLPTTAAAYVTEDVTSNPGYLKSSGKLNPFWESYNLSATDVATNNFKYVRGTTFIISQYVNAVKDGRLPRLYTKVGGAYVGVVLGENAPLAHTKLSAFAGGIFKSFDMPAVLMLAAESSFLLAEAKARNLISGGDGQAEYTDGIQKSYQYLYKGSATLTAAQAVIDANTYLASNIGNPLIDFAASPDKQETIIYQKYLALNAVTNIEGWNEYRRTGFPKNLPASLESNSTRPDKLPVRLLYPTSELSSNPDNIRAQGIIDQFTSRIFWDVN
ncbi:SusD/RagB family nutrient-binding outer membrane lipoprotein [Pedobacter sp. FW305-3-2-15-E-R2A2]|uniref:SusD/RagB family nutrient-binding outer membrane lipoprotein n=1 Tax=Pedobacter sp. FW305-3-2-15-E-R2A2 TaxID=3140251 RepID=UPI00313FF213